MEEKAFLRLVRRAVATAPDPGLPPSLPATPASGRDADAERFAAAVSDAGGKARMVSAGGLAETLKEIAGVLKARRAVVSADTDAYRVAIDEGLRAAGTIVLHPAAGAWREAAAAADLGVTSAVLGVASTGSVLIVPDGGSPRVASLLPGAHVVLMPGDRIVPGLEEALDRVAATAPGGSAAVLVTGPSKTADIEMIPVFGVHGPRAVWVLVLTD